MAAVSDRRLQFRVHSCEFVVRMLETNLWSSLVDAFAAGPAYANQPPRKGSARREATAGRHE